MSDLDAIIIGAGHNGLTCAAYLGMAGLRVRVLERRGIVGGACVTEEFYPGFRNSTAAYTVSLLQSKIIHDLKLQQRGLRIVERRAQNFLPLPDGRYLVAAEGRTEREIAKFSVTDAARYPAYQAEISRVASVLRSIVLDAPPNLVLGNIGQSVRDLGKVAAVGKTLWRDGGLKAALRLLRRSAGDILDGWFDSDPIKALLGFDAVVGNFASPYTPGSGYVLLHHVFGEVNGKPGVWGHAIGGMGAITKAMASAATEHGVRIDVRAPVREIFVERGRAAGVVLQDGTPVRARTVIANVDPQQLLQTLVAREMIPRAVDARMQRWKAGSATFRMNVALSKLPDFSALPGAGDHLTAGIILAPSLAYMDQAYRDCVKDGWSRAPIIEMLIPSTLDDSLAPPGAHVASLFCQHVAPAICRRRLMGTTPRDRRRPDDRHGRDLRAGLQGQRDRAPEPLAARSGARLRLAERRHFPWRADARSTLCGTADARICRLSHAARRALSVRLRGASRRRRDRRAGSQRRASGDRGPAAEMSKRFLWKSSQGSCHGRKFADDIT